MSKVLVSIVMPIYNPSERELRRAINSCMSQTYDILQVLAVDDGSLGASASVTDALALQDDRTIAIHWKNQGVSSARNLGMKLADGEYIAFLDADDEFHGDFVTESVSIAESNYLDAVIGTVVFRYRTYDEVDDLDIPEDGLVLDRNDIGVMRDYIISHFMPKDARFPRRLRRALWGKLFVRKLASQIRFDESITYGEDAVYVADVLGKTRRVGIVDRPWYVYYQNEGTAVRKLDFGEQFEQHLSAMRNHYEGVASFRNSVNAEIANFFFATLESLYLRSRGLHLREIRVALGNRLLKDALKNLDFKDYDIGKRGHWPYLLCRYRCALIVSLWYRHVLQLRGKVELIEDR